MSRPVIHLESARELRTRIGACPVCRKPRALVGQNVDRGIYGCRDAIDLCASRPNFVDERSGFAGAADRAHNAQIASEMDEAWDHMHRAEVEIPALLAAMARPGWLEVATLGRPAWTYAVGTIEPLLWAAIEERRRTRRTDGPAAVAYFAALDARWERCVNEGRFAPGVWSFRTWLGAIVPVPDSATIVCACSPNTGCHLERLAPWLAKAWDVRLYGRAYGEGT
jgi:hypothetical protein